MKSWRDFWKVHPAADVFPLMDAGELRKLADDIAANGLRIAIQTRTAEDGQLYVIDGRNRLDACELLGWPVVDDKGGWSGKVLSHIEYTRKDHREIVAEVISLNLHRRHLNESQRAMIAAELANMKKGRPGKAATLPIKNVSQSDAATLMHVSERSVRTAKKVLNEAPTKIVKAVKSGKLAVSKALKTLNPKVDAPKLTKEERRAQRMAELTETEAELAEIVRALAFWEATPQEQRERFIRKVKSGVNVWKGTARAV